MAKRVHFCLTPHSKPERLQKQRELALATQPWLKSTGPRTESGKKRSSQNAVTTTGLRSKDHLKLAKALRGTEQVLQDISTKFGTELDLTEEALDESTFTVSDPDPMNGPTTSDDYS